MFWRRIMWRRASRAAIVWCLLLSAHTVGRGASAESVGTADESQASPATDQDSELNLLLLNVTLERQALTDVLSGYELGNDILLPLGELARLLTIGVMIDEHTQTASGFVLQEDLAFRLEPKNGQVIIGDRRESFEPGRVRWMDGDLYVAAELLQQWWPVNFKVDISALNLDVRPRVKLPLQARLERERNAKKLGRGPSASGEDPGYPYVATDYKLATLPFIDNTLSVDVRKAGGKISTEAAYTGFLTGDLLGMESTAYFAVSKSDRSPDARLTLSRHDPDAGLLGPLRATTLSVGNIGMPTFENVMRGTGLGNGLLVSNRPLSRPTSYRSQSLRGELPPGWDVTLYFNDALIAFQQARSDGRYEFENQPLAYGRNEFKLVFNGPLGQTRVERHVFEVDQTMAKPGEFFYTLGGQYDKNGNIRQTLQLDFGIVKDVGVTLGGMYINPNNSEAGRSYANAGARAVAFGSVFNVDHVRQIGGGAMTEVGVRTSLWNLSIDASHVWSHSFRSEFFSDRPGSLNGQDRLRLMGGIKITEKLILPVYIDVTRDNYTGGGSAFTIQQRLSLNIGSTSFTNSFNWRSDESSRFLGGVLQLSRRVIGVGLSGQLAYSVRPDVRLNSLALNADKNIGGEHRVSLGVIRNFTLRSTTLTAGINRNFGPFGLGVSAMFGGTRSYGVGIQLFTALGRNPRSGQIVRDWRPMAGSGLVAAQVFIDDNLNGRFDRGEDPVEGIGFTLNKGSLHPARTDARGRVLLDRLMPKEYTDIAPDLRTIDDVQLQPSVAGVRLLPRPGRIQKIDFPLIVTGEIDGTIYLMEGDKPRGIGNALIELVDANGDVIASARSASDGFYILASVKPGKYRIRVAPDQKKTLALTTEHEPEVTMPPEADFISGINLTLRRAP